jgi:hypothetical protein
MTASNDRREGVNQAKSQPADPKATKTSPAGIPAATDTWAARRQASLDRLYKAGWVNRNLGPSRPESIIVVGMPMPDSDDSDSEPDKPDAGEPKK